MTVHVNAAVFADETELADLTSIIDEIAGHPEGSHVMAIAPDDTPWGAEWPGLALVSRRRSILLPVVGAWPLGFGSSSLPEDLERTLPMDVVPALRSMRTETRRDGDVDSSYAIAGESMERIARIALAHVDRSDERLMRSLFPGQDSVSCEVGMEQDGTPIVWVETVSDMHRIHLPEGTGLGMMIEEPLLLMARRRNGFEIPDVGEPTIILSPMNNDEQGTSMEIEMPSAMEVLRIMTRWRGSDEDRR